jgi:hypothetical protein
MSTTSIAYGIAVSAERESIRVIANYQSYLGRPASAQEVSSWVNAFAQGMSNEDMIAGFIASPEYYNGKGIGDRLDWVKSAYQDVLGRQPNTSELMSWVYGLV